MGDAPRYTVKKYIALLVLSGTLGLWIAILLLYFVGFPDEGLLLVALGGYPITLGAMLVGFLRGLVKYYGFREPPHIPKR